MDWGGGEVERDADLDLGGGDEFDLDADLDLSGEDDLSLDDGTGDELSLDDDDPLPAMDDDLDLGGEDELPPLDASSQDPDETVLELDTPAEEALEAPTEDAAIELELDETSGESMVEIDEPEADDLSIEADTDEITLGMEADDLNLEKDEFQAAPDVDIGGVDLDLEEIESAPPEVDSFEEGPDAAMEDEEIVDLDLGDSEDAGEAVAGGVFEAVPDVDIDEVKFEDLVGAEFEEMEEEVEEELETEEVEPQPEADQLPAEEPTPLSTPEPIEEPTPLPLETDLDEIEEEVE